VKAVLIGGEATPYVDVLRSKLATSWKLFCIDEHTEQRAMLADADALICVRFDASFPPTPAMRLLQAPATGLNRVDLAAVPSNVAVCNSRGHEVAVAEYCILAMLASAHQLLPIHSEFVGGRWFWSGAAPRMHAEVFGSTVCLVGLGGIGREVARRAKALGMRVIACNRSTDRVYPEVDELAGLSHLQAFVARADFVIVACALTDETTGIINGAVLGAMKKTAFLVNVGRGPLIDEEKLYRALQARQIAGAVLDVWFRYPSADVPHPRPSKFPFHELDNVIMTPHVSGWTDGMVQRRWTQIASNLDRLVRGEPLDNVVRPASRAR
jgi:phosphoglycerate dehydrogenase-like enzyme